MAQKPLLSDPGLGAALRSSEVPTSRVHESLSSSGQSQGSTKQGQVQGLLPGAPDPAVHLPHAEPQNPAVSSDPGQVTEPDGVNSRNAAEPGARLPGGTQRPGTSSHEDDSSSRSSHLCSRDPITAGSSNTRSY